ncbi:hypothetical protein [Streptococcus dentiloxodontae]
MKAKNKRRRLIEMQPDEKLKREMTWKNNLFNRYLLFRYSLALFFFANIYWIMIAMYKATAYLILPLVLLILTVMASAEQLRLYGKKEAVLKWTKRAFQAQGLANIAAVFISLVPSQFSLVFPVFENNLAGKGFVIMLQLLAIIIVLINLNYAKHVEENSDKFYYRFQKNFGKTF